MPASRKPASSITDTVSEAATHQVSRRTLVKGAAGLGVAAAASTAFSPIAVVGQEKTPVVFWTTFSADGLANLTAIVDAFNAQSADVAVEIVQLPPAEVTDSSKLLTAVRGGTGPDVYLLDRFIVAERAAQGALQDLTPLCEAHGIDPELSEYVDFAVAEAQYGGRSYALPFDSGLRALYFNKDILNTAGVDLTPFDPANGPPTWDQVKEIAISTNQTNADGSFSQMGFVPWFEQGSAYTYGFSWNGTFMDYEACEVTPTDPLIVESGDWIYQYAADLGAERIQAFIQAATQTGAPPQESPWYQGRLAFLVSTDSAIANTGKYQPDMDFGITYLPVPEAGMESSTWAGGWSLVTPMGARQPDAAFQFMKFISGPEGQRMWVQSSTKIPTWKALYQEDIFQPRHKWMVDHLLETTKYRPPLPVGAKYWDELVAAWELIFLNQMSASAALQTAKDNTMRLLGQYCPVPPPIDQR